MDHIVYLDAGAKEMEKLLDGSKIMIIRGAAGRKMPYRRVEAGDILYFINNNSEGLVKLKGEVSSVLNSEKMDKETSVNFVNEHQDKLQLSDKQISRWAGKRYLVLIELKNIEEIEPFAIDKSNYGNMDDWLPVGDILNVRLPKEY